MRTSKDVERHVAHERESRWIRLTVGRSRESDANDGCSVAYRGGSIRTARCGRDDLRRACYHRVGPHDRDTRRRAKRHVLLVEDEPPIRELVTLHLSLGGFEVDRRRRRRARARSCSAPRPSICSILDVMLPGLDGITLCRAVRSGQARTPQTPILMLTARDARSRQGARPRERRRRLPHQAVRGAGADGPRHGHPPPRHCSRRARRPPEGRRLQRATSCSIRTGGKPSCAASRSS